MRKFFYLIWFVYSIALLYPDLERYTYYNEIFSLLGLLLSLHFFTKKYKALTKVELVYFIFLIFGFFLIMVSYTSMIKTGMYLSLRTMPIFYNSFCFILGYYLYQYCFNERFYHLTVKFSKPLLLLSLIMPWRLTPQVFAMLYLKSYKAVFFYLTIFILVNGGSTSITAILFVGAIYLYKSTHIAKKLMSIRWLYLFILLFFLLLYFSGDIYEYFLDIGYEDYFGLDVNLTWRYMFWVYLFQEVIINNPFMGIGFGTPLFLLDIAPDFLTSDDGSRNTEYTLGTHNSLVYLISRMGGVGLFIVLILHVLIYSKAFKAIKKNRSNKITEIEMLTLSSLMFLNSAIFNVVLETPLYGGLYWVTLGLLYSSLKARGHY